MSGVRGITVPAPSVRTSNAVRTSRAPSGPVMKRIGERPQGPARPSPRAGIELPLLAPTGHSMAAAKQLNRQQPPNIEYTELNFSAMPSVPADAPVLTVRPSGREPINKCIESAPDGAVIKVPSGTYKESISTNKTLYFVAEGQVVIASDIDIVKATGGMLYFEGFVFLQDHSQSASAVVVEAGTCTLKSCALKSNHTVTIMARKEANLYMHNCTAESTATTSMMVNDNATVVCSKCRFSAATTNAVLVRGKSKSHWKRCAVDQCGRNAFVFSDSAQFIFEHATVSKPMEFNAQTSLGLVKNCKFEDNNPRVGQNGTPYFEDCSFNKVSLECKDTCGVRIMNSKFFGNDKQPGLLVYGDSTVAANNCEWTDCTIGAAVAVYKNGSLKTNGCRFLDISGSGILAFGRNAELECSQTAFVNLAGSGVVVHSGASLTLTESLFESLNSVGVMLEKASTVNITKCKFATCVLSGIEANSCTSVNVNHCLFSENNQCGFIGIDSTGIKLEQCDFEKNKLTGVDLRNCTGAVIAKSITVENSSGGYAFRTGTKVEVQGGGIGANHCYGIAAFPGSTVTVKEAQFIDNEGVSMRAAESSTVVLDSCTISDNDVAVVADGNDAKITMTKSTITNNQVGVQCVNNAEMKIEGCKFSGNSVHMEVYEYSDMTVLSTRYEQSKNGVGVLITNNGKATFRSNCTFVDELQTAICNDAECILTGCSITDCGTCGIYWHGEASGEISECQIARNGSCGIQLMGGQATVAGCTIEGHGAFGIHVQPTAMLNESGNIYNQNTMAEINNEP